jgi:hypothetical protein
MDYLTFSLSHSVTQPQIEEMHISMNLTLPNYSWSYSHTVSELP